MSPSSLREDSWPAIDLRHNLSNSIKRDAIAGFWANNESLHLPGPTLNIWPRNMNCGIIMLNVVCAEQVITFLKMSWHLEEEGSWVTRANNASLPVIQTLNTDNRSLKNISLPIIGIQRSRTKISRNFVVFIQADNHSMHGMRWCEVLGDDVRHFFPAACPTQAKQKIENTWARVNGRYTTQSGPGWI